MLNLRQSLQKSVNIRKHITSIFCSLLVLSCTWMGVLTNINNPAQAQELNTAANPQMIAFGFNNDNNVKQKAKEDFDTVFGDGSSDRVAGKAQKDLGTVEKNLGKVTGQTQGLGKQVQGRAKQDIGRVKGAASDLASEIENKTDNAVDSIQDMFGS